MPGLISDSAVNRMVMRSLIWILSSYGPFCLMYTTWALASRIWRPLSFGHHRFLDNTTLWILWMPEALFVTFFHWYTRYIQGATTHPPLRTKSQRVALFNKMYSEIYEPVQFLRGWFRGSHMEDISRDGLRQFVDWVFWDGRAAGNHDAEIEGYVDKIADLVPITLSAGPGRAKSLRLTVDPIEIGSRTLLWYTLIMIVDTYTLAALMSKGYHYYRRSISSMPTVFPPRPATIFTRNVSVASRFSYFLKPHTSRIRLPVLFIHGIGIGLLPAIDFLNELHVALNSEAGEDDQVGIIAVEVLQISSRLTTPIPSRTQFLVEMKKIVNKHFGNGRFVLASHSYGSVLSTHIVNDAHLSTRLSGVLLVDPVSIMLHLPDVAYNFTVRPPVKANEWQMWYFASKDPQIAHTLGRHFFWSENILWRERIDHLMVNHKTRVTTSLASDDLIVNAKAVRAYLTKRDVPEPIVVDDEAVRRQIPMETHMNSNIEGRKTRRECGPEVLWWEGYDHGDVFDRKEARAKLVYVLVEYVHGT